MGILLTAARQLSDARLAEVVGRATAQIVARAERAGAFALDPMLPPKVQQLSSVLLWQIDESRLMLA